MTYSTKRVFLEKITVVHLLKKSPLSLKFTIHCCVTPVYTAVSHMNPLGLWVPVSWQAIVISSPSILLQRDPSICVSWQKFWNNFLSSKRVILHPLRVKTEVVLVVNYSSIRPLRRMVEWMYRSTFSFPWNESEVSGQLHAHAPLFFPSPGKETPIPIG
jgi:hypothetical protein